MTAETRTSSSSKVTSTRPSEPWHLSIYVGESVEAETLLDILYTFSPLMLAMVPECAKCAICQCKIHYSGSVTDEAIGIYKSCDCYRKEVRPKQYCRLKYALSNTEICRALQSLTTISTTFEVVLVYLYINLEESLTRLSIAAWVPSREVRLQRSGKYSDLAYATRKLLLDLHGDLSRYCINGNVPLHFAIVTSEDICARIFDVIDGLSDTLLIMTSQCESVDIIRAQQLAGKGGSSSDVSKNL